MVITLLACALIFFLQSQASLCNARMDTTRNQFSYSIYKDLPGEWYDPIVSWKNKHDVAKWRTFAKAYLPGWLYYIINAINPGYDPFSDFWHFEKVKMKVYELLSFIVGMVGIYLFKNEWAIISFAVVSVAGWNLTFNRHLKSLLVNP
jgi:hypothetical protein